MRIKTLHFLFFLLLNPVLYVTAQPVISAISPPQASAGDTLHITGTGFHPDTDSNFVWFGGVKASVAGLTASGLTVIVPEGAYYAPVSVVHSSGLGTQSAAFFRLTGCARAADTMVLALPSSVAAQGEITGIVVAELDQDSLPDVVVCNKNAGTISLFRNISAGNSAAFDTPVHYNAGVNPSQVHVADLDGDGRPDILVADPGSAAVLIFRNQHSGTGFNINSLSNPVILSAGPGEPVAVVSSDLDQDGRMDIASVSYNTNTLSIWKNLSIPGTITMGSFGTRIDFQTGSGPLNVVAADINNDALPELITADFDGNTISLFANQSTGTMLDSTSLAQPIHFTVPAGPADLAAGDFNNDSKTDLAVSTYINSGITIYENISGSAVTSLSFAPALAFPLSGGLKDLAITDLDLDGKADLIACAYDSSAIAVMHNKFQGLQLDSSSFALTDFSPCGNALSGLALADLNSDTLKDVLAGGTVDSAFYIMQNLLAPQPAIISSGPLTFCGPGTVTLDAGPATGYLWNTADTTRFVTAGNSGNYSVYRTHPTCSRSSQVTVTINYFEPEVFRESMGTVTSNTSIATHESNLGFDHDGFTFTGNSSVRATSASAGYPEASGGANIYIPANPGDYFEISDINTTGWQNLSLAFGIHKGSIAGTGADLVVESSADGINYSPLAISPLPTGSGTTGWYYRLAAGTIPASANLRLRFTQNGNTAAYRLDDIRLFSSPGAGGIQYTQDTLCTGDTIVLTAIGTGQYLWSTGDTTKSVSITAGDSIFVMIADSNGCGDTTGIHVYFHAVPSVGHVQLSDLCAGSNPIMLTGGSPPGGDYSGAGVDTGYFDPQLTGTGNFQLYYTYIDSNGCAGDTSFQLLVYRPAVTFTGDTMYCIYDQPFLVNGGIPGGGIYQGNGINNGYFDPAAAGLGQHQLIYTYTDTFGCSNSDTLFLTVDVCSGFSSQMGEAGIRLYPNPATDMIRLDGANWLSNAGYIIHDMAGKNVAAGTVDSAGRIWLPGLPPGAYRILIMAEGNSRQIPFMIR